MRHFSTDTYPYGLSYSVHQTKLLTNWQTNKYQHLCKLNPYVLQMPVSSTTSRCKNPWVVLKNLSPTVSFHQMSTVHKQYTRIFSLFRKQYLLLSLEPGIL